MSEHPYGQSGQVPNVPQPTGQQPMMPQGDPNAYMQQQYPQQQYQQQYAPAAPSEPMFSNRWISILILTSSILAGVGLLCLLGNFIESGFGYMLVGLGASLMEGGLFGVVVGLALQVVWVMLDKNRSSNGS